MCEVKCMYDETTTTTTHHNNAWAASNHLITYTVYIILDCPGSFSSCTMPHNLYFRLMERNDFLFSLKLAL